MFEKVPVIVHLFKIILFRFVEESLKYSNFISEYSSRIGSKILSLLSISVFPIVRLFFAILSMENA